MTHFTYAHCEELFATRRKGWFEKKLEGNTYLSRFTNNKDEWVYVVLLYSTPLVEVWPDGTYVLYDGGKRSNTTKKRLNTYGPARVWQWNDQWWLRDGLLQKMEPVLFFSGVRVDSQGVPTDPIFRDMLTDGRPAGELAARLEDASQGR